MGDMEIAVCPRCRRAPAQDENGYLVCAEHGRLSRVELVHAADATRSRKREDDVPDGSVVGRCEAVIVSVQSDRCGKMCCKPARYRDRAGKPVCGMHRPGHIERLTEAGRQGYIRGRGW